jgi:tetratricopeptide (TPR) repeat protein
MAIRIVCKTFEGIDDRRSPRNWSRCNQFISHIEFMESFAKQYGLRNATLLDASTWATIYLDECELYQKAASMHKRTWERKKVVLGEEHPSTLTSMANLASTYRNQGRWKEAKKLQVRLMKTTKRVLGQEHPSTLSSMANLASTYRNQGRWKEAKKLQVKLMKTRKRVMGQEHPDTLSSMNNLAFTLKGQGQNAKAINLMQECIRLGSRILGVDHPHTLSSSAALTRWQR